VTASPDHLGRLLVHPRSPHARSAEPLTAGLPLPRGRLADVERLTALDADGRLCPSAARVLERWSDGTIRWALIHLVADVPAGGTSIDVTDGVPTPPATPLMVLCDGTTAEVSSGVFLARFDVTTPAGLTAVSDAGRALLAATALTWNLRDAQDLACAVRWSSVTVEQQTALAATVVLAGTCQTRGGRVLRLTLACRFAAGRRAIAMDVELHNPSRARHRGGFWELGDAGSVLLRSASVTVSPFTTHAGASSEDAPNRRGADAPSRRIDAHARRAELQLCPTFRARLDAEGEVAPWELPFDLTQHSSGGERWNSPVHVTADGTLPFTHRGYVLRSGAAERAGLRAEPTLIVGEGPDALLVTAPRFWQVFPKALQVAPSGDATIAWLPAGSHPHEIQGGERCHFEFALGFGDDEVTTVPGEWLRAPSIVLPDPDTAAAAEAIPRLVPASRAGDTAYEALVSAAIDGDDTFEAKRERIDEFGWRNFGDLYADHENGADPSVLRVSHYNNQYDAVAGLITQALRTGDPRWWVLADDLANHVARIDIYWTDEDKAAYNGGLFWHTAHYVDAGRSTHRTYPKAPGVLGGGPSNEHCYSTGLLLHHRLTGAPLSAAAVTRLAQWAVDIDDGAKAPMPLCWLSRARTGYASATNRSDYHGPGRGPANVVQALLNGLRVTGRREFLAKAREIVERVVHPEDDIDAWRLADTERRWSYTVMLQALGRYIDDLQERGGLGDAVDYARATLVRYARWVAAHEFPYLDKPELLEFPTETWAAQDLRKAAVLDLAAQHSADPAERTRFAERASTFHRTALDTLASFPTRTTTRPVVLVMTNGLARAWHQLHRLDFNPTHPRDGVWPPRVVFVPQKTAAKRRLVWLVVAASIAAMVLAAMLAGRQP
jgi:hypothetical protein